MKGPFRDLIPVGAQDVRLRLPAGLRPRKVQLLAAGQTPKYSVSDGLLRLTVSSVLDHEIVAIDV
jgi:hypothetical protein